MSSVFKKIQQRAVLVLLLALPVSVYVLSVVFSGELNFKVLEKIGPKEVVENADGTFDTAYYKIPDYSFVNQYGDTVTRADMEGKIYVASFFFTTCPTICPSMNFHLKEVYSRLSSFKDVRYLSHSIDPTHDSVPVLRQYARDLGVENTNTWYFVTGDKEEIFSMADAYFLAAQEDSLRQDHGGYYHSSQVVLVDWDGHIRSRRDDNGNIVGAYDISEAKDIKAIVDDLRVLTKEYRKVKMER
ncbi:SCO family protein [Phaeocystidibacter luteus]|uniref:SCO family protein n=1 Tax=Phaeocystidibacter luteus TaxID=911197 RepID=A0A6N6RHB2_9FLAO|nr:SCO family protein [Phaeocystidibacter luteus]